MALAAYLTATRQLVGDPAAQRYSDANLTTFINTGRSQLALEGECVRFNYGFDGIQGVGTFTQGSDVVNGVTMAAGDTTNINAFQLAGPAIPLGSFVVAGSGSSFIMVANRASPASSNALLSGTFSFTAYPSNETVTNQETYTTPANLLPLLGVANIIGIRSVSINYGSYGANQYMLRFRDWTTFQAFWRTYNSLSGNPSDWTRYENTGNTVYLRPIPSAAYPMQWDCTCSAVNLVDDTTPEAIPYSYTDSIPYFAAYLALMSSQRKDDAQNMLAIYERFTKIGRRNFQSTIVPDVYEGS